MDLLLDDELIIPNVKSDLNHVYHFNRTIGESRRQFQLSKYHMLNKYIPYLEELRELLNNKRLHYEDAIKIKKKIELGKLLIYKSWSKSYKWTLDLDGYPQEVPHWLINTSIDCKINLIFYNKLLNMIYDRCNSKELKHYIGTFEYIISQLKKINYESVVND